jgi:hypothetical protein
MMIGGHFLAAGDELHIAEGDYLYGSGPVRMVLRTVIAVREEWGHEWVVLDGQEKVRNNGPWRYRRLQLKVDALRKSLTGQPL